MKIILSAARGRVDAMTCGSLEWLAVLIMGDPAHPEHGEMLDWYGGAFDPSAFDVDQANRMLAHIRL